MPRGLFAAPTYLGCAITLALAGIALAGSAGWRAALTTAAIVVLIIIYTAVHKQRGWSVIPMGLCRASLVFLGLAGMLDPEAPRSINLLAFLWACYGGLGLFCYIAGLSMSARYESMKAPPPKAWILPRTLLAVPALLPFIIFIENGAFVDSKNAMVLLGIIPYLLWLGLSHSLFRKPIPRYVSALLAGIPLVDWIILLPLSLTCASSHPAFPSQTFEMTCLFLPPLAFISGRLLQRLAPAT